MFRNACFIVALAGAVSAQTFEIGGPQGQSPTQPQSKSAQAPKKGTRAAAPDQNSEDNSLVWGSSLEVSREIRASDDALKHNNPGLAYMHAQRVVEMAPGDKAAWFTLGYAARLAGHLSESERAYKRALQLQPGSAEALSGLAQTYYKMGRVDEAKKLLLEVVQKYPNRVDDQLMAGELFMQSGDIQLLSDAVPGAVGPINTGKVKAIGIADQRRSPFLPDVPTIAEQGVEGVVAVGWIGLSAPARTPEPILDRLSAEVMKILKEPEVLEKLKSLAFVPAKESRQEFEAYIAIENTKWRKIVQDAGIKIE